MSGPLKFAGRVVVVTGAGTGLGRAYALAFAERGASIVVNDIGSSTSGEGQSFCVADAVVAEIKSKGGSAVANYDSVENGGRIVEAALEAFGRIDVLINNAGIVRDRSFEKITKEDWSKIMDVHLTGVFKTTQAAWPAMCKQCFGRIIMTGSTAGLYGNFDQAVSTAKSGLIGLARSLAKEGEKYNILANVVCPLAGTRLLQTVLSGELVQMLKPDYCVPLVLNLARDDCKENGCIFETGGGWTAQVKYYRTEGAVLPPSQRASPEALRDHWCEVVDFSRPSTLTAPDSPAETAKNVIENAKMEEPVAPVTWSDCIGRPVKKVKFQYTPDRTILYALGIGCSQNTKSDLRYLYEDDPNFSVFPTFAVIPPQEFFRNMKPIPGVPTDLWRVVHAESYIELLKPFPKSARFVSEGRLTDIVDKKVAALLIFDIETKCAETGEKMAHNQFVCFFKGSGGFGGPRQSEHQQPLMALTDEEQTRTPDAERAEKIGRDQNALYRLSGDKNPLHIDPNFAGKVGFSQPILHGLCSLGFAMRHVLHAFSPAQFCSVKVRFSKPVFPVQTLRTKMWKRPVDSKKFTVLYQTSVDETGEVCLNGQVELINA